MVLTQKQIDSEKKTDNERKQNKERIFESTISKKWETVYLMVLRQLIINWKRRKLVL